MEPWLFPLLWLAAYLALGAAALPLAALPFRRFPDRGAAFAIPLALALVTLVAFWVGHLAFGPPALAAGLLALVAASLLARRHAPPVSRRGYVAAALVFTAAFAVMLSMRAAGPNIHPPGGEKFLDYGLLRAVLRADALPPEDMWFAGKPVRYYYGGQLLVALLTMLTATPPNYAYNVGLAGAFGTLAVAAYGLASAVADGTRAPPRLAGVLGAFLVAFAGNLATPGRALLGFVPRPLAAEYGRVFVVGIRAPFDDALEAARWLATDHEFTPWLGRYVIPDTPDVFPMWTFVNGDLRAHMLSAPFLLLGVAVCYAYYRTPADAVRRRRALVFGALPPVAGLLAVMNTWSLPALCGVAWLALALGDAPPETLLPERLYERLATVRADASTGLVRLGHELRRSAVGAALAVGTGLLAVAWGAPYLLFHTPPNEGIGLLPPRSNFGGLVLVHGAFLAFFALAFAPRVSERVRARSPGSRLAAAFGALAALAALVAFDLAAVALVGPFLLAGWWLVRTDRAGFEGVLLVAGAGLVLAVEFVYAKVWPYDPNALRWNTIYKVYMHVWLLWGAGAAVALASVLAGVVRGVGDTVAARARYRSLRVRRVAAVIGLCLLVATAAFPAFAVAGRLDGPLSNPAEADLTLDGTAYLDDYHPYEARAIRWFDGNVSGTPTIVSKDGYPVYTWQNGSNPVASLTGIPTVLGWEHERGYRGDEAYYERRRDVRRIYTADWPTASDLLAEYDVQYVYVGPVEREAYDVRDFAPHEGITVAYQNERVTVYAVNQSALRAAG